MESVLVKVEILRNGFRPVAFDDVGNSVLGDAEVVGDPAIASSVGDGLEHLRREPVRFGALAVLAPELATTRPGGRQARLHALAEQIAFELRNPRQHCGHHPSVRRIELERHSAHRDHGDLPPGEPVERVEEILRRASPAGQFGDQYGVDPARLGEFEDPVAREPVVPGPRGGFPEDAHHLEPTALGEGGEFSDLAFAGLVGG